MANQRANLGPMNRAEGVDHVAIFGSQSAPAASKRVP